MLTEADEFLRKPIPGRVMAPAEPFNFPRCKAAAATQAPERGLSQLAGPIGPFQIFSHCFGRCVDSVDRFPWPLKV